MKRFLKFFSLMFLSFVVAMTSCFAVNDCRFIKNQKLISTLGKQFISESMKRARGSEDELYVGYENIVFAINKNNISGVVTTAPILDGKRKIIGEAITLVTVQGTNTIDGVLNCFMSNLDCAVVIHNCSFSFFKDSINPNKYAASIERVVRYLKSYVFSNSSDQIFYMVPPNVSNENLQIAVRDENGNIRVSVGVDELFNTKLTELVPIPIEGGENPKGFFAPISHFLKRRPVSGHIKLD
ncbi:MAG: hypothetical protein LBR79_02560 [Oscillospiraceae bacterium]|jgi:hypothetical protein|nr:hypothetical protein [Oscillospiraceae bacterium]